MSEPLSVQVAKAIEDALEEIRVANGYHSDLGLSVHRGFYAHAIDSRDATFPLVAVQPESESIRGTSATSYHVESSIRLVVVTNDVQFPADVLRACVADVRRVFGLIVPGALAGLGLRSEPELGAAEFAIAADSPITLAGIPASFSFVEKFEV